MTEDHVALDVSSIIGVENMKVHELLINAQGTGPNVLIMMHDMTPEIIHHVVRFYALKEEADGFSVQFEIAAFSFEDYESSLDFANKIPTMSAIEMLLILNTDPEDFTESFH